MIYRKRHTHEPWRFNALPLAFASPEFSLHPKESTINNKGTCSNYPSVPNGVG